MEQEVLDIYSYLYNRIWIQRSKYRLCVTVFPIGGRYRIFTSDEIYHGFGQDTNIQDVIDLVNSNI